MTPDAFADWLKNYTQSLDGPATAEQWEHIREVLASVEKPTYDVFRLGGLPFFPDQPLTC